MKPGRSNTESSLRRRKGRVQRKPTSLRSQKVPPKTIKKRGRKRTRKPTRKKKRNHKGANLRRKMMPSLKRPKLIKKMPKVKTSSPKNDFELPILLLIKYIKKSNYIFKDN